MVSRIRDRTSEFRATVDSYQHQQHVEVPPRRRSPMAQPVGQDSAGHSHFMQRASLISADLQSTLSKLDRLTRLTRDSRAALLDDRRQAECVELGAAVESSIARINRDITDLRALQDNGLQQQQQHSGGVVVSLQSRLADATRELAAVLREREAAELERRRRREQYSSGLTIPTDLKLPSGVSERHPERQPLLEETGSPGPRFSSYQQLSLVQSQDTSYLEARSAAVQSIERSINDIGHIFQQLTHMIAEQGELVQRIDANIDDVGIDVQRGHLELLKYYRYVNSNRWLLLKLFCVLIVFMFIFNALFL